MDVVPDDWSPFEDSADVFQCLNGDLLADHLATCTQDAIRNAALEQRSVILSFHMGMLTATS